MARWYDVMFHTPVGNMTIRSSGNTRRSAEGTSRRKLRDRKMDPAKCFVIRTDHVPANELDPDQPWLRPGDRGYRGQGKK